MNISLESSLNKPVQSIESDMSRLSDLSEKSKVLGHRIIDLNREIENYMKKDKDLSHENDLERVKSLEENLEKNQSEKDTMDEEISRLRFLTAVKYLESLNRKDNVVWEKVDREPKLKKILAGFGKMMNVLGEQANDNSLEEERQCSVGDVKIYLKINYEIEDDPYAERIKFARELGDTEMLERLYKQSERDGGRSYKYMKVKFLVGPSTSLKPDVELSPGLELVKNFFSHTLVDVKSLSKTGQPPDIEAGRLEKIEEEMIELCKKAGIYDKPTYMEA